MIGRVLDDRYELKEFIGKGGMALVYRAEDRRTGHQVAVKILRPEYNQDEEFLSRFEREANTASKMSHHNIINLLDVGQDNGFRYLVMEYVKGKTLKEIIRDKGALPPEIAAQIAIRILSALQHAHGNGIIHRDIKPQNVLVHAEGHIKVADFGIARVAGSNTLTKSDNVMGSVYYFSPEQARGSDVTAASDIYSVGVVLYEMLTGKVPFDGDTPVAVAMQQINGTPRSMQEFKPGISPAMEKVVLKAMEKKPENRYQSALEMAQDLHRAMHEPEGDWLNSVQDMPVPMMEQDTARQKAVRKTDPQLVWLRLIGMAVCVLALYALIAGSVRIYNLVVNTTTVPYLLDETEDEATKQCIRAGLKVQIVRASDTNKPAGTVLMQTPEYDTQLKKGETVLLTISTGPEEKKVPDVRGKSLEEAASLLEKQGITLLTLPERVLSNLPWDTVIDQTPAPGGTLPAGGILQVSLSGGSVTLPELSGKSREEAIDQLMRLGIDVAEIKEIIIDDGEMENIVAAQQYRDQEMNPYNAGDQVTQDTVAILAVYVQHASENDEAQQGDSWEN